MVAPAEVFKKMAARIERIEAAEFAGAVVIFPPNDHEPIVFLTTDPHPSAAQFFAAVQSRLEIGAAMAQDKEAKLQPFRRVI